jgi:two-component system OmpR family response regulator
VTGPRIMIVEDDPELQLLLQRGLAEEGFVPESVSTAAQMLDRAAAEVPDALIVDIGLPDADGRDACQALRARGNNAPVLFLTARDALPDRLSGFAAGGDDYLTKPFPFPELVARLRAQLRRAGVDSALRIDGLTIDPSTHTAMCGEATVRLTPTEFRLLALLASHPGEAVRRRQLVQAGWPDGAIVHANTLDAYLARIRRKLRMLPTTARVTTIHGVGYSLR